MILSFKKFFAPLIFLGLKIHTIREDAHNRWKPGRKIHFAIGVRTKNYKQFHEAVCVSTQKIRIKYSGKKNVEVFIDDRSVFSALMGEKGTIIYSGLTKMELLAKNDGFNSITDFFEWFNKDFSGKIIHWTNFKYE